MTPYLTTVVVSNLLPGQWCTAWEAELATRDDKSSRVRCQSPVRSGKQCTKHRQPPVGRWHHIPRLWRDSGPGGGASGWRPDRVTPLKAAQPGPLSHFLEPNGERGAPTRPARRPAARLPARPRRLCHVTWPGSRQAGRGALRRRRRRRRQWLVSSRAAPVPLLSLKVRVCADLSAARARAIGRAREVCVAAYLPPGPAAAAAPPCVVRSDRTPWESHIRHWKLVVLAWHRMCRRQRRCQTRTVHTHSLKHIHIQIPRAAIYVKSVFRKLQPAWLPIEPCELHIHFQAASQAVWMSLWLTLSACVFAIWPEICSRNQRRCCDNGISLGWKQSCSNDLSSVSKSHFQNRKVIAYAVLSMLDACDCKKSYILTLFRLCYFAILERICHATHKPFPPNCESFGQTNELIEMFRVQRSASYPPSIKTLFCH